MEQYGADGVRVGMLLTSPAGNDLPFDEKLCEQGRNFANKIWNAYRLTAGWQVDAGLPQPEAARTAVAWMESRLHEAVAESEALFAEFRLSEALMATYKLVWDDFCSVYLELAKPAYGQPIDAATHAATGRLFAEVLKLLHPYMPFLSEELWHWVAERKTAADDLCVAAWPVAGTPDAQLLADFAFAQRIIAEVRTVRNDNRIGPKEPLVLYVKAGPDYPERMEAVVQHLAFLGEVRKTEDKVPGSFGFVVGTTGFYIPFHADIDVEAERAKLGKDIAHLEGFIRGVEGKLANAQFVANAPAAVVDLERRKAADAAAKLDVLRAKLAEWG
jgi:valyl-tRNA synthetase